MNMPATIAAFFDDEVMWHRNLPRMVLVVDGVRVEGINRRRGYGKGENACPLTTAMFLGITR